MTQYIFMNHRIREKKPSGPVIVAQDDLYPGVPKRQREANEFELWHHGEKIGRVVFKPEGLAACDTHVVNAWVELDDLVTVANAGSDVRAAVASAKKPNSKVRA